MDILTDDYTGYILKLWMFEIFLCFNLIRIREFFFSSIINNCVLIFNKPKITVWNRIF